jgi:mannose-1-phosphate guanylyltransferase
MWLKKLEQAGCESVLINTHYLSEKVEKFLRGWKTQGMTVETIHEHELLGTAGTLMANQEFFKEATGLLIHADNFMEANVENLLAAHNERQKKCILTMLTFNTDTPNECGIVEVDELQVVKAFHEKVLKPPGNRANGALYAFDQDLLHNMNLMRPPPSDFSTEVIPKLIGKIQGWHTNEMYIDIGSVNALTKTQTLLSN